MSPSPAEMPTPVGQSPAFLQAVAAVSRAAPLSRSVLIIGERGTGKELLAARLHYLSPRWSQPFITLNCGALNESLIGSELFGHEMGAFTGAQRRRQGRFEMAHRGTLFLDEIANAPLNVQEAILRVVEYGRFERLGGGETVQVDVRLVAAANQDLPALADKGRFRHDLLDRLAFDVITLPPLRERIEDIELLANHVAVQMTREMGRPLFPGFSSKALELLSAYPWPGNVRELKNVIERAVYRSDGEKPIEEIVFDPFRSPWRPAPAAAIPVPTGLSLPEAPFDFVGHVEAYEKGLLQAALQACQHHQKRTADYLKMSYHQLRNHLRKHGLIGRNEIETG